MSKAKKHRIMFLILMTISALGAGSILHFSVPGTPLFTLWGCVCADFILLFLISGTGLLANLFQWVQEAEEQTND